MLFLKISQNSQENTCARVSFLAKLQLLGLQLIKKETLAQVFSSEFWEISKNTFFKEHLWTTASEYCESDLIRPKAILKISFDRYWDKTWSECLLTTISSITPDNHYAKSDFIKITLRHRCSPVNLLHIFRTPFSKNTSGGLLLHILCRVI